MRKVSLFLASVFFCSVFFVNSGRMTALADDAPRTGSARKPVTITVAGQNYSADTAELDLSGITSEDVPEIAEALPRFSGLTKIILPDSLPAEDFLSLAEAAPEAAFEYHFELYHQPVSVSETTELMFRRLPKVDDEAVDFIERVIPHLPRLETVSFNRCTASDERLDALREAHPEITVRWVVQFAAFSAWSDTETIWAMAGLFHDEDTENLKYFHNIKNLDIGHNGITRCDFLYEMPDMEVLILAIGDLEDITPIASLKKLEYLEICDTKVEDLSPLSECVSLEHLNLGGIPATDLTPLYSLTNLKRLFADNMSSIPAEERLAYEEKFRELLPEAEVSFLMGPEGGVENGFWRYSRGPYQGSFVERYELLREQFGYTDNMNQAYVYD